MRKLWKVLRKHRLFIILFVFIVEALLSAAIYFFMPDRFESTAMLLVSRTAENLSNENNELDSKLLTTYNEICSSESVLEAAAQQAGIGLTSEEFKQRMRITNPRGTNLILIRVWSNTPQASADLANALADSLTREVRERLQIDNLQVMDVAKAPASASRAHIAVILGIGFGGSLLLSILFIAIVDYFDDTLRTPEQVAEVFGKPVIGNIPHGITRLRKR